MTCMYMYKCTTHQVGDGTATEQLVVLHCVHFYSLVCGGEKVILIKISQ